MSLFGKISNPFRKDATPLNKDNLRNSLFKEQLREAKSKRTKNLIAAISISVAAALGGLYEYSKSWKETVVSEKSSEAPFKQKTDRINVRLQEENLLQEIAEIQRQLTEKQQELEEAIRERDSIAKNIDDSRKTTEQPDISEKPDASEGSVNMVAKEAEKKLDVPWLRLYAKKNPQGRIFVRASYNGIESLAYFVDTPNNAKLLSKEGMERWASAQLFLLMDRKRLETPAMKYHIAFGNNGIAKKDSSFEMQAIPDEKGRTKVIIKDVFSGKNISFLIREGTTDEMLEDLFDLAIGQVI